MCNAADASTHKTSPWLFLKLIDKDRKSIAFAFLCRQAGGNKRLQQTQAQVDEVVDIMRVNVDKVLERDQKLSELDDRAGKCFWLSACLCLNLIIMLKLSHVLWAVTFLLHLGVGIGST